MTKTPSIEFTRKERQRLISMNPFGVFVADGARKPAGLAYLLEVGFAKLNLHKEGESHFVLTPAGRAQARRVWSQI
jgi:hypothetical protein